MMSESPPRISVEGLTKIYRRAGRAPVVALDSASFAVGEGEVMGVVGRNGAGKSTLLKLLARITRPSSGSARLRGKVSALLEVGTGFHPDLSGRENVFLNGTLLGMSRREIRHKLDAIVNFSEVGPFLDLPVKRYSSGMSLRLAFAVAAHLEPQILLVDEVLAVGDFAFQQKCLEATRRVAGEGRTVLFVSHNLGAVHRLCRRTLWLDRGRVAGLGPTPEVVSAYLSAQTSAVSHFEAEARPGQAVRLRRITLVDDQGRPLSQVGYHDPIRFLVDYDVNEPVSGVSIGVGLGTIEYQPLFTTADYDCEPERLGKRAPGKYRGRVEIPGEWLNTGKYVVQVYVSNASTRTVYDSVEAFTFDVVDTGTASSYHGVNFRRGCLQPRLPWAIEPREEAIP